MMNGYTLDTPLVRGWILSKRVQRFTIAVWLVIVELWSVNFLRFLNRYFPTEKPTTQELIAYGRTQEHEHSTHTIPAVEITTTLKVCHLHDKDVPLQQIDIGTWRCPTCKIQETLRLQRMRQEQAAFVTMTHGALARNYTTTQKLKKASLICFDGSIRCQETRDVEALHVTGRQKGGQR